MRPKHYCLHIYPRLPVVLLASILALGLSLGTSLAAFAHPLGNFTVNRYSKLTADAQALNLLYIVDMAEIPAHAERAGIDADGDGSLSGPELDSYRSAIATQLVQGLALTIDGTAVALQPLAATLSFPTGQAGLPTLRLELHLQASLPGAGEHVIHYVDGNYADRLGWQEVIVVAQSGAAITDASVPAQDRSHGLTVYPQDLLSDPPRVSEASFAWQSALARPPAGEPGSAGATAPVGEPGNAALSSNGRPVRPIRRSHRHSGAGVGCCAAGPLGGARLGRHARHVARPRQNAGRRLSRGRTRNCQARTVLGAHHHGHPYGRRLRPRFRNAGAFTLHLARTALSLDERRLRHLGGADRPVVGPQPPAARCGTSS